MSQPSRPRARGPEQRRRRREIKFDQPVPLEERRLLAPVVATYPLTVTTSTPTTTTNEDLLNVTVGPNTAATAIDSAAPITSVSELTPASSFGGDIVSIAAGPGGVFGDDVYAISRGAGDNADDGAINRPGVIYRVDTATGKTSVFFDLNTVLDQTDPTNQTPSTPAANGLTAAGNPQDGSGLVNWYSITFDSEGTFSGTPAMFVSSSDRSDPNKNIIYEIAPNGTLMGVFVQMTDGLSTQNFSLRPTAILIPPVQDQSFLSGLIAGNGISSTTGTFAALYFQSTSYSPGQVISNGTLPTGVSETDLTEGPIVGLTASNSDYDNEIYSAFTDFGTPAAGGIPARTGLSGVQGSEGDLLIGNFTNVTEASLATTGSGSTDLVPAISTNFRRLESIAFDQYGYFSQSIALTSASTTSTSTVTGSTTYTVATTGNPTSNGGNLFVSDLATGLYVSVTPLAPLETTSAILVPVTGSGVVGVTTDASGDIIPVISDETTIGGRILRILPDGVVETFAYNFATSSATDFTSFIDSSLTISFSADGTTLFASDDEGIWQFKTTADLADSTSGTLVGLNDLRTLGVPYDGEGSAVAVVDTGVDASSPPFRGRVAPGTDLFTGGFGNVDYAPSGTSSATTGGGTGGTGGTGGGGTVNTILAGTIDGHGTPVAGVIAQFVPQATIVPIDIFVPFTSSSLSQSSSSGTGGTGGTGGGTGGTSGSGSGISQTSNALSTSDYLYNGLQYVVTHPFVNDPVRPGKLDRIIAASFAFGTTNSFGSEVDAYKQFPQVVIALKNLYHKFLKEGIAPIAAAGEFGAPLGASSSSSTSGGGTGGTGSSGSTSSLATSGANNADNKNVGDSNGMALPAVLNEVISVTGVYSFPYDQTPGSPPTDQFDGLIPNVMGPVLLYGSSLTLGGTGTSSSGGGGGTGGTGGTTSTTGYNANAATLMAGDFQIYANRVVGAANRSDATDFAAPAVNVPTFRRTFSTTTATTTGTTTTTEGDPLDHNTFTQVGTSMSAAIVTGSFALISSALTYWTNLSTSNGYTADAYLTTPVGVDSLNFGKHVFENLQAWNNPSGINAILAWTAVPATDANDAGSLSTPTNLPGSTAYKSYATVNVANAVAAIEGSEAIHYLLAHHDFQIIDTNHDGTITAQELQNFVNDAASMGLPEAGSMAALLGGTATYSAVEPGLNNEVFNENPDDPAAEQRRFNFFDYAADGQLNGGVTISQFKMLARILLPPPDAYTITDRQRASANGFLLDPTAERNFVAMQRILPQYEWVPASAVKKYRNISPARFKVGRGLAPGDYFPLYTLFDPSITVSSGQSSTTTQVVSESKSASIDGSKITVDWLSVVPSSSSSSTASTASSTVASTNAASSTATTAPPSTATPSMTVTTSTPSTTTTTSATTSASSATTSASSASAATQTPEQAVVTSLSQNTPTAVNGNSTVTSTTSSLTLSPAGTLEAQVLVPPASQSGTSTTAATAPIATSSTAAAATPPPTTTAIRRRATTKKSSSSNSVYKFFDRLASDIKKAFK